MKNYHIVKKIGDSGRHWILKEEHSDDVIIKTKTKFSIIQEMREFMGNKKGSVKIHKMNGRIQEERTYPRSYDPIGSKG